MAEDIKKEEVFEEINVVELEEVNGGFEVGEICKLKSILPPYR